VVSAYGRVIVLEDDIVVSEGFLDFMNDALSFYENKKEVWHISAHSIVNDSKRSDDVFLWRVMNCWGWATWADRWQSYEKKPDNLFATFTEDDIRSFNLDGYKDFWGQVEGNRMGVINTWAVFWYATIFINNGLCVNPYFSYAKNTGLDGSGVHCVKNRALQDKQMLNRYGKFTPQLILEEDENAVAQIKRHFATSERKKILRNPVKFLIKMLFSRNVIEFVRRGVRRSF
jgi:GR25 family glycosyltransferase involved in LPS biosynthesis